jgi:hypothetical protein
MSAGQVAGLIDDLPSCAELIARIMDEAAQCLGRLGGPGPGTATRGAAGRGGAPPGSEAAQGR